MKWKHKIMGWEAKTEYYDMEISKNVSFLYEVDDIKQKVYLPFKLFILDNNWEEIPDGRWLDETCTIREFMEAFAMVITESASGHDSYAAKAFVDKKIKMRY